MPTEKKTGLGSMKLEDVAALSVQVFDRECVDCDGPVTLFILADKVWDGLGLAVSDWICLHCIARRLKPNTPPGTLGKLNDVIARQLRRFKLERDNWYNAEILLPLNRSLVVLTPESDFAETRYADDCGRCTRVQGENPDEIRRQFADYRFPFSGLERLSLPAQLRIKSFRSLGHCGVSWQEALDSPLGNGLPEDLLPVCEAFFKSGQRKRKARVDAGEEIPDFDTHDVIGTFLSKEIERLASIGEQPLLPPGATLEFETEEHPAEGESAS